MGMCGSLVIITIKATSQAQLLHMTGVIRHMVQPTLALHRVNISDYRFISDKTRDMIADPDPERVIKL